MILHDEGTHTLQIWARRLVRLASGRWQRTSPCSLVQRKHYGDADAVKGTFIAGNSPFCGLTRLVICKELNGRIPVLPSLAMFTVSPSKARALLLISFMNWRRIFFAWVRFAWQITSE